MNKTQFKLFEDEVRRNLKDLLLPYDVGIELGETEDETSICDTQRHAINRAAKITFNKDHGEILDDQRIKQVAYHECLEILMGNIRDLLSVYYSWEFVDEQIHIIIRSLENAMLNHR